MVASVWYLQVDILFLWSCLGGRLRRSYSAVFGMSESGEYIQALPLYQVRPTFYLTCETKFVIKTDFRFFKCYFFGNWWKYVSG